MKLKMVNHQANAMKANRANALKGCNLDAKVETTAQYVALFLKTFARLRQIDLRDDESFVGMMRELGGWKKVIEAVAPEPDAQRSAHGVPTNVHWFRWDALVSRSEEVKIKVVCKLL